MKIFTFLSGKGGTGKSMVAANAAFGLAEDGHKVLLFDSDFGLSNLETMTGVELSTTLAHLVRDDRALSDGVVSTRYGFDVIGGGSGSPEMVGLSDAATGRLFDQLVELGARYDYVIVDAGPGLGSAVLKGAEVATEVVLVTTPDATSLTDAYAVVRALGDLKPALPISMVVNRAANEAHGERVAKSLQSIFGQFLSKDVRFLGAVREDPTVGISLAEGRLVTQAHEKSGASQDLFDVATTLISEGEASGGEEISILDRIKRAFGKVEEDSHDEAA